MKPMIGAVAIAMLAGVAAAQSLPGVPQAVSQPAAISGSGSSGTAAPGGLAMPGSSPKSESPIDQAKTEIECKIPSNAAKPECLELLLKK
jgi:hypothetical protein